MCLCKVLREREREGGSYTISQRVAGTVGSGDVYIRLYIYIYIHVYVYMYMEIVSNMLLGVFCVF